MFLHQALNYKLHRPRTVDELEKFFENFDEDKPMLIGYDTETTGLHIKFDRPFLYAIGYFDKIAVFEAKPELVKLFLEYASKAKYLVAHNAKYDYHMTYNLATDYGFQIPENINFIDSMHVARYTEPADSNSGLSLEALGTKYVASSAKEAGKEIREILIRFRRHIKNINRNIMNLEEPYPSLNELENEYDKKMRTVNREFNNSKNINEVKTQEDFLEQKNKILKIKKDYENKIEEVKLAELINSEIINIEMVKALHKEDIEKYRESMTANQFYQYLRSKEKWEEFTAFEEVMNEIIFEPNYETVYKIYPNLMINYAADDVVIMLEYLRKAWNMLELVDEGLKLTQLEADLLKATAHSEQGGVNVDLDYLHESRKKLEQYVIDEEGKLNDMVGVEFSVNQNALIKDIFADTLGVEIPNTQEATLSDLSKHIDNKHPNFELAVEVGRRIAVLRKVNKSLSTSIIGKLRQQVDGKIYVDTKQWGTVTGRVSNDMQQYPSGDTLGIYGEVLFSPRRMIIPSEGSNLVSADYSQMEIRGQAQYTLNIGKPDITMLKSVMPYKCVSFITGEEYDKWKHDMNSGEWIDPDTGEVWTGLDLHGSMAQNAFKGLSRESEDYDELRDYAKRANFLIIYGGGVGALKNSINITYETARQLYEGFETTFPNVKAYHKHVDKQLALKRYVENFAGRKYIFKNPHQNSYKAYNYLIQGGTAYVFKKRQIVLDRYLRKNNLKARMLMPIHDEMMFEIPKEEMHILPDIKAIMEYTPEVETVPMIVDFDGSDKSWADFKPIEVRKEIGVYNFKEIEY